MMDYVFMSDSNSDIPYTFRDEFDMPLVYMPYYLGDKELVSDLWRGELNNEFYVRMRAGEVPRTSLLPTAYYYEVFEPIIKDNDILFIAYSSQLSTTFENLCMARNELLEKYPHRKFIVVDSMSVSGAQLLLLLSAHKLYREGKPMEEVAQWAEENKMRVQVYLTVDDLVYLKRGGRISGAASFFGSMLSLKPILVMGRDGKINPAEKVQGRKKALRVIAERVAQNIENPEDQDIFVMHADIPEDGELLANMIREKVPNIRGINALKIGPVVGTHCGPGTVACSFFGKERVI